ncbi:MAG: DnaA regulatory inactivator Hda [Gammaproteobacteria bacterium]|nr:DnaA regulatory inactivator Hda [Gammaproteobacteria bacterium]
MKPTQLSLGVRLRDDATFANYYPGANAVTLGYVEHACETEDQWMDSLLYIWGNPGSGRSHLLQAACLRVEERGGRALYLPLADLAKYGTQLLDNVEFCDLVCLDDVEAVLGQPEWEEALFHAFNRLRDAGKQLLIAANAAPRKLPIKLPDLQSRLSLALVFQLHELSDDEKLRALQLRASRRGLRLSDDVGRFILARSVRSMTVLFDTLEQLDTASLQAQRKLTIPFLKEALGW